jgi:hypothetical protein
MDARAVAAAWDNAEWCDAVRVAPGGRLQAARRAGFVSVGPLRVWLKD